MEVRLLFRPDRATTKPEQSRFWIASRIERLVTWRGEPIDLFVDRSVKRPLHTAQEERGAVRRFDAAPSRMIAAFTAGGVLPPFLGSDPGDPVDQSPYEATLSELVDRFATSRHRCDLLLGLFAFRAELRRLGFVSGFQWIDGSFVEDAEAVKGRPPGDIDVVTVARRPTAVLADAAWEHFIAAHVSDIFDPDWTKAVFRCDAYPIDLDADPEGVAAQAAYWFGLFSHQRITMRWKGIVTIRLEEDDTAALVELSVRATAWP